MADGRASQDRRGRFYLDRAAGGGGELSGSDVWSVSLLLLRGGAGAPAISTSPEPVIALNNVDRSHKCSAPFSKVPASPCACFAHRALHLLEQASSASARLDSKYLPKK